MDNKKINLGKVRDSKIKISYTDLEKLKQYVSKNYNLNERVINDCDKYYRR